MKRIGAETEMLRTVLVEALQATFEDCEKLASELSPARKSECEYHTKHLKQVLDAVLANDKLADLHFDFGKDRIFHWSRNPNAESAAEILQSPYALKDIFGETVQRAFYRQGITSIQKFAEVEIEQIEKTYNSFHSSATEEVTPFLVRRLHKNLQKFRKELLPSAPSELVAAL